MIPWLRLIIVVIWVSVIAGIVVIAGLAMGQYSAATFHWAGIIGAALGIPAGLLNWIWLRPNRSREIGWNWPIARRIRALSQTANLRPEKTDHPAPPAPLG